MYSDRYKIEHSTTCEDGFYLQRRIKYIKECYKCVTFLCFLSEDFGLRHYSCLFG